MGESRPGRLSDRTIRGPFGVIQCVRHCGKKIKTKFDIGLLTEDQSRLEDNAQSVWQQWKGYI